MEEDKKCDFRQDEGVNAAEKKKNEKYYYSCAIEELYFETESNSKTNFKKYFQLFLNEESLNIEDFNYHKFTILQSHVTIDFI
jgi:hypothetical protein